MVQIGHLSDRDGERMSESVARELASKGEDVTEIVDVIRQLEDISAIEGVGVAQTA
jgi:hypothetical protein